MIARVGAVHPFGGQTIPILSGGPMSRIFVFTVLLAGLTVIASSLPARAPADPAAQKKTAVKEKPADKDVLPTGRSLVTALVSPVDFPGVDDPKETLIEALAGLTKRYHVTFDINEKAFKYEM